MDRRRAAGALLVLAACVAYATAAPTASNHTSLDLYDGTTDGCYYNFQHYREGDRIMTNEPCLNCTCHNRMLMCYLRVCPFTKPIGQDCTIEKRADQCCPIVTCPDVDLLTSTTTSPAEYGGTGVGHADKYGCSINGKYFSEGSKVPPTPNKPCEHCYCIRNMTTCVMQECTLHVDGCTPIYHKDVCCPVRYSCDHPEDEMPLLDDLSTTVRPTPGFLLTTTTLAPVTQMTQDCLYENKIIPDGALIKTEKACDHCYCMKGDIVCVVQECGTPMENEGKNCTAIAPREGVCCPDTYICEGDEPTTETYDGPSYTTVSEMLTTKVPPRRVESEGSGYRNEPDDILKTESPTLVSELEGSGDEDSVTEALPVSHEPSLETDTATKTPAEFVDLTTEGGEHKDVSENVPTTTSSSIVQSDELLTTKAQDEEIGSGEEDITTDKIVPMTSDISTFEDQFTSEPSLITTKPSEDESSGDRLTKAPILHEDQNIIPSVTKEDEITKSTLAIEDAPTTEQISVKTTSSIPTSDGLTTGLYDDKEDKPEITQKPEFLTTTSAPGIEDDIVTTESQGLTEDHEVPGAELEPHHEITMTASTPLLEEIEKDTIDQQKEVDEDITDIYKTSTTLANVPIMTIADHDNKPDLLDETIATNIPTTVSTLENDESDITTAEPQTEEDIETGSDLEGESKKTTPSDYIALEPQTTQHTLINESSEPEQYVPITTASISDGESQKTILPISITTSKPLINDDEKSELLTTTSSPSISAEIEIKKTTPSEAHTLETESGNEANIGDISKPPQPSTTTDSFIDGAERVTSPATISTSSESEFAHDVTEESTESQKYTPTTIGFVSQEESKKTTQPAKETESEVTDFGDKESATEESSDSQHYSPTTSSSLIEEESKKTTTKDVSAQTEYQQNEVTTIEPDKGLNTIPSGSIEEETTEADKYTQPSETITTGSVAELQNKFDDITEASIASSKQTTPIPDIPQETTVKENVGDIVEQTSLPAGVSEEAITSSTESPVIESQETGTASVPLATETVEQDSDSKEPKETKTYESSTEALQTENTITVEHETSSPSYPIIPESTTANLEENEIVNEPRIPGEGDCLFDGVTYRNESAVPSTNKCQSDCRCISSIIKCDPIICSAAPEYMDNCQPVYDSLDSCCPTYVCDHKTETMPPQSHSQMSGTEAPVSPVKCNGDECVLSDDKKQPDEIPPLCDSGDCTSQVVISPQPSITPEQPVDNQLECTGDKCVPASPANQLCNEDSGCEASPVKPCEGSECEITSPTTNAPPKLEPCADGICNVEVDTPETKPHDGYIEKECTEKSCKRKGDSKPDQQVPGTCSGLECESHESKPAMELTTAASITLSHEDSEQEVQTISTDLANVTEKGEISESPDTDSATKPTVDTTDETIDDSSQTKTTITAVDITTQLPNLHERPEETSTQRESATPSENDNLPTESTLLPEAETEKPLVLPDEKQADVTTEIVDIASSEITTTLPRETENDFTLIDVQNKPTEIPEKDVFEDRATSVSEDVITEQPITHDRVPSESPHIKPTDLEPPITISTQVTHDRETSEQSTIQPIIVSTTPLEETYDSGLQQTTQPPMYTQFEETTATLVSKTEEITKSPQESDINDVTKIVDEEIDSTLDSHDVTKSPESTYSAETTTSEAGKLGPESPKPENDQQYITTSSEDTLSEVTTPTSSDDSSVQEVTKLSEKNEIDDITPNPLEKLTTISPISLDLGEKDSTMSPGTETDVALDVTTHSETDIKQTTTSSVDQDVETTKTRTELPEVTEPSKAIEIDTTKQSAITEPSNVIDFDEEKATKTPETIISETTIVQQEPGMEVTSIETIEETGTESFISTYSPHEPDNESIATVKEETSKSDDSESQGVTQPTVPESVPPQDTTVTLVSTEDEHKTTFVPYSQEKSTIILDTASDNITPSILPDSRRTEPAVTSVNEITTIAYDHYEPTEQATESSTKYIDEITLSSSISPIHEEEDITTISEKEITETPLNLVTESEQSDDVPAPETDLDKTDKTVSKPPKEYDTKTPVYELETTATELMGDSDKTTQKPEPTRIINLGEDKTEAPLIQESEKDTIPEITTKPNDATTLSYPKEPSDETLDITTKLVSEDMTTELPIIETETKIPDGFTDIPTDKPIIREGEPKEPEKDEFQTEAPYVNKLSTSLPVDFSTEKATKETETPQVAESTEHAQPEEEIPSTRIPSISPSEAVTAMDAKLTTLAAEQTTELSKVQTPTELSVSSDEDAKLTTLVAEQTTELSKIQTPTELTATSHAPELPTKVYEKEPSELPIDVGSTSSTDVSENKEPETVTEISDIPELTTQEADKDTNTEYSGDKIATEDSNALVKEKEHEVATESGDQMSHEPSQATVTETLYTDERGTTIAPSQDSDEILLVTKPTKTPESIETSSSFSEKTTIKPDEDIEKSPDHVSTSKHEYPETSTSINIVEEKTTPVDVTETPMIILDDQHMVNLATETQPASTETATKPHQSATELLDDDLVTGKPTLQETTPYSIEETQKPTSSPVPVEIITEADQSLTSIEPHVEQSATTLMSDIDRLSTPVVEQSATTVISDIDRSSTPVVPEIEVETEIVTPSSEKPLLVPSTEISAQDDKIPTTAKAEDTTTSPVFEKFTTPAHKPTELAATEQPKPIPTEQPTDEIISPDDEPPSGGSSGYGTDPDYMEEDQTFGPGTCRYGGKVYVSAQQIPRDDPCDFCFCFRSDIICLQQSCPPPIHGCHEEPISGFCCPRYECPVSMATTVNVTTTTTTTTTTLPPHFPVHSYKGSAQKRGCLIKGHTYKVGEVVRASSGPCLHCTCGGDGQMKCDPKQCTPEPMLRQMIAAAVSAKRRR